MPPNAAAVRNGTPAPHLTATGPCELGHVLRGRIRPTYQTSFLGRWQTRASYPKSNSRRIAPGISVHWRALPWSQPDLEYDFLQVRRVHAAAFEGARLVCGFQVNQTRLNGRSALAWEDYSARCADVCGDLGEVAYWLGETQAELGSDPDMHGAEATAEVTSLMVTQPYLGTRHWAPAILTVLAQLARTSSSQALTCVLQAAPLELAWRQEQLHHAGAPMDPLERTRALQRARALERLYQRELGFTRLGHGWMGALLPNTAAEQPSMKNEQR